MHKTVLPEEAVAALEIKAGDVIVDGTLGAGGHTLAIAEKVGAEGKVVAIDLDQNAISDFKKRLKNKQELKKRIILKQGNFKDIAVILQQEQIKKVDGILLDLGWRIEQVENSSYGMSFLQDSPLDMRLDKNDGANAYQVVNQLSRGELSEIFRELGEEKQAWKIAGKIVQTREQSPIKTTTELADLVKSVKGINRKEKKHPATKVFQALRIYVNQELSNLSVFLDNSLKILNSNGKLAIISFHSLEDRIVKNFFRKNARGCICPKEVPICVCNQKPKLKIKTKKPIKPAAEEILANPRARSASLRVAEKL